MTLTSVRFHPSSPYKPCLWEKKKPVSGGLLPTPIDDLSARGVMCVDRALVEMGKVSVLVPKLVRIRSEMIRGNLKNSFLEFQPVTTGEKNICVNRRMSCPDMMVKSIPSHRPPVTTYMIRNIPTRFTSLSFVRLLEEYGFAGAFDFLYLPVCGYFSKLNYFF
jgi:hypothetical protein